jgi:hypothetical protein
LQSSKPKLPVPSLSIKSISYHYIYIYTCVLYTCQIQQLIKITHFHSVVSTVSQHHQAIQSTNIKLLSYDSYMDPYITNCIQCVYKIKIK